MHTHNTHLSNLLVGCNAADKTWPEPIWNEIREPKPPHGRHVVVVHIPRHVTQHIVGFGVAGVVWHEGGDEDLALVNL